MNTTSISTERIYTVAGKKKGKKSDELDDLRVLSARSLAALVKIQDGEPFDTTKGQMQAVTVKTLEHYRKLDELVDNGGLVETSSEEKEVIENLQAMVNRLAAELRTARNVEHDINIELDEMRKQRDQVINLLEAEQSKNEDLLATVRVLSDDKTKEEPKDKFDPFQLLADIKSDPQIKKGLEFLNGLLK